MLASRVTAVQRSTDYLGGSRKLSRNQSTEIVVTNQNVSSAGPSASPAPHVVLNTSRSTQHVSGEVLIGQLMVNGSDQILAQLPPELALLNISHLTRSNFGKRQQRRGASVPTICFCNHVQTVIIVTVGQGRWRQPARSSPVGNGQCFCFAESAFHRNAWHGERILCSYQIANEHPFPCAGARYFVWNRYTSLVGHYEYRATHAGAPSEFKYAGPARFVGNNMEPILAIFSVVICNQFSDTPVDLIVAPRLYNPPWSAHGQASVSKRHSCTALHHYQIAGNAIHGQQLYCLYVANGASYTCGGPNSLLPWRYSALSEVAAYVVCESGSPVPVCTVASMKKWMRW